MESAIRVPVIPAQARLELVMNVVDSRDLEPDFGHWLAGFIAGEGCFSIYRMRNSLGCKFSLRLRDDDEAIIKEIYHRLGFGTINRPAARNGSQPQIGWDVNRKDDCLALVSVLDRFSLRAKKATDYAVWRRAVLAWAACDYDELPILAAKLSSGRAYEGLESPSELVG